MSCKYVGTIGITKFTPSQLRRIREAMGRVLPSDKAKRVYNCGGGVFQVENDEQRDRRLARGRK